MYWKQEEVVEILFPIKWYLKKILKDLGIEGNYEGIGHCAIGYKAEASKEPAPRKDNYVYCIK